MTGVAIVSMPVIATKVDSCFRTEEEMGLK